MSHGSDAAACAGLGAAISPAIRLVAAATSSRRERFLRIGDQLLAEGDGGRLHIDRAQYVDVSKVTRAGRTSQCAVINVRFRSLLRLGSGTAKARPRHAGQALAVLDVHPSPYAQWLSTRPSRRPHRSGSTADATPRHLPAGAVLGGARPERA